MNCSQEMRILRADVFSFDKIWKSSEPLSSSEKFEFRSCESTSQCSSFRKNHYPHRQQESSRRTVCWLRQDHSSPSVLAQQQVQFTTMAEPAREDGLPFSSPLAKRRRSENSSVAGGSGLSSGSQQVVPPAHTPHSLSQSTPHSSVVIQLSAPASAANGPSGPPTTTATRAVPPTTPRSLDGRSDGIVRTQDDRSERTGVRSSAGGDPACTTTVASSVVPAWSTTQQQIGSGGPVADAAEAQNTPPAAEAQKRRRSENSSVAGSSGLSSLAVQQERGAGVLARQQVVPPAHLDGGSDGTVFKTQDEDRSERTEDVRNSAGGDHPACTTTVASSSPVPAWSTTQQQTGSGGPVGGAAEALNTAAGAAADQRAGQPLTNLTELDSGPANPPRGPTKIFYSLVETLSASARNAHAQQNNYMSAAEFWAALPALEGVWVRRGSFVVRGAKSEYFELDEDVVPDVEAVAALLTVAAIWGGGSSEMGKLQNQQMGEEDARPQNFSTSACLEDDARSCLEVRDRVLREMTSRQSSETPKKKLPPPASWSPAASDSNLPEMAQWLVRARAACGRPHFAGSVDRAQDFVSERCAANVRPARLFYASLGLAEVFLQLLEEQLPPREAARRGDSGCSSSLREGEAVSSSGGRNMNDGTGFRGIGRGRGGGEEVLVRGSARRSGSVEEISLRSGGSSPRDSESSPRESGNDHVEEEGAENNGASSSRGQNAGFRDMGQKFELDSLSNMRWDEPLTEDDDEWSEDEKLDSDVIMEDADADHSSVAFTDSSAFTSSAPATPSSVGVASTWSDAAGSSVNNNSQMGAVLLLNSGTSATNRGPPPRTRLNMNRNTSTISRLATTRIPGARGLKGVTLRNARMKMGNAWGNGRTSTREGSLRCFASIADLETRSLFPRSGEAASEIRIRPRISQILASALGGTTSSGEDHVGGHDDVVARSRQKPWRLLDERRPLAALLGERRCRKKSSDLAGRIAVFFDEVRASCGDLRVVHVLEVRSGLRPLRKDVTGGTLIPPRLARVFRPRCGPAAMLIERMRKMLAEILWEEAEILSGERRAGVSSNMQTSTGTLDAGAQTGVQTKIVQTTISQERGVSGGDVLDDAGGSVGGQVSSR